MLTGADPDYKNVVENVIQILTFNIFDREGSQKVPEIHQLESLNDMAFPELFKFLVM